MRLAPWPILWFAGFAAVKEIRPAAGMEWSGLKLNRSRKLLERRTARKPLLVVAAIVLAAIASLGVLLVSGRVGNSSFPYRGDIGQFAAGRRDALTLDRSRLTQLQRKQLNQAPLAPHVNVGDLLIPDSDSTLLYVKRPVVVMLDKLIGAVTKAHPTAILTKSQSTVTPDEDRMAGSTGFGPHVRGESLDVAFEIPGMTSRAAAVYLAQLAYRSGVKGIAVLRDEDKYSVHLDPVRIDPWYAEQVWQQVQTPRGKRWVVYYQGVDPARWSSSGPALEADPNDIVGDWLSTTVVSGKTIPNGSALVKPTHLSVYRKPNGHYGLRILNDTIPDVTALWDAYRERPDRYVVQYDWKQTPPSQGVEQFRGTLQMIHGEVLRTTKQSNPAYPGEVTTVSAHWVRISRGQGGPDPELSCVNGVVYSHGFPASSADATRSGGQFIDRTLFERPEYRESAPSFVPR